MTFYLNTLSRALAAGDLTARELTETCLEAIASEDGKRAFIEVYSDRVRVEADHIDRRATEWPRAATLCRHSALDQGSVRCKGRSDPCRFDRYGRQCRRHNGRRVLSAG